MSTYLYYDINRMLIIMVTWDNFVNGCFDKIRRPDDIINIVNEDMSIS